MVINATRSRREEIASRLKTTTGGEPPVGTHRLVVSLNENVAPVRTSR
jgi:hypothetical protein